MNRIFLNLCQWLRHPGDTIRVRKFVEEFEREQWLDGEEIRRIKLTKIKALLQYAYNNVPFYREKFDKAGVIVEDIKDFKDFAQIPILTKDEVRTNNSRMISRVYAGGDLVKNHTGGSTGVPLTFFQDRQYHHHSCAADVYVDKSWGIYPGDKTAILWGNDRDTGTVGARERILLKLKRWERLNSFRMSEKEMREYAGLLLKWKPKYVRGYASSLALFARFLIGNGITGIRPAVIRSSAETLSEEKRRNIERAFASIVLNFYGSREINNIAAECIERRELHILGTNRYVEIAHPQKEDTGSMAGKVIVTDMVNYGMPFIRYQNDDVAEMSNDACPCGRGYPVLKRLLGRTSDFIVSAKGEYIHGEYFTHLFYGVANVRSFQIYQKRDMRITIYIVKDDRNTKVVVEGILRRLISKCGGAGNIEVAFVEEITPTPSGKHRFTISEIAT